MAISTWSPFCRVAMRISPCFSMDWAALNGIGKRFQFPVTERQFLDFVFEDPVQFHHLGLRLGVFAVCLRCRMSSAVSNPSIPGI
jgi:hypothetical protein